MHMTILELRAAAAHSASDGDVCLDELAIAELVDGVAEAEHRAAMLAHVAGCATCRSRIASVARLLDEPELRSELEAIDQPTVRRRVLRPARVAGIAGLAAAAALILLVARPGTLQELGDSSEHRDPVITLAVPPSTVQPVGAVEVLTTLVWTSVPRADLYEVTLFGSDGTVLWEAQISDTFALLPDSVPVLTAASYFWRVRARTGWDRWTESELTEFTLNPPGGAR